MTAFLFPALVAAIITFFTTPLVIRVAKRYKLVDDPQKRRHPAQTHKGIVPRAGGIALLIGYLIATVIFLPPHKTIIALTLGACITVIIGLWDDLKDISPYIRIFTNIAIAVIVVGSGIGIPFITNPFDTVIHLDTLKVNLGFLGLGEISLLSSLIAIVWIVWTMNIVGWSAGVDGQMPGFVVIASAVLGILSLRFSAHDISQELVATLAFITMGTFLGFLPWNFYPQKIMPGYGGKTLAGLLLATIAILSGGKLGSALLLLAIPMIDASYILLRRLMSKKSPFKADRRHFHHYLLDIGWGKRKIALFYWLVSFILGLITLSFTSRQKLFAFVMVAVIVAGAIYWISQFLQKNIYENEST